MNIEQIKLNTPNAWGEFIEYYQQSLTPNTSTLTPEAIPFPFFLGSCFLFFREVSIELDLNNTDTSVLPTIIMEAFQLLENNMAHFS
ncbi:MAG: hypothetical protein MUE33_08900 [Cytophagaceae bacterium]|jgi:hypothetical protein|nr:hypothetical protein [Cytophagaceae bacterium]